jgi:DNA invertase Pin-like site-specific DNA recombinase
VKLALLMKTVGYARVSTCDQSLQLQIDALQAAKCEQIFCDEGVSGAIMERDGLEQALARLEPGDKLVVWRLDRLGRSLIHLVNLINDLADRRVEFQSITESIDTCTSGGRLVFHMMAALAEFERSLISERTRAGMTAVQKRGGHIGRPRALKEADRRRAIDLVLIKGEKASTIAKLFNIHPRTLMRAIQEDMLGSECVEPDDTKAAG